MSKNALSLVSVSFLAFMVGCTAQGQTTASAVAVDVAPHAKSDVAPTTLVAHAVRTPRVMHAASSRLMPGAQALQAAAEYEPHRYTQGVITVPAHSTLQEISLPISHGAGTRIVLAPIGKDPASKTIHLEGSGLTTPDGLIVAPHQAAPPAEAGGAAFQTGMFQLEAAHKPGAYSMRLMPDILEQGAKLLIVEPESPIVMSVATVTPMVLKGSTGTVRVTLMDGTTPIVGATVSGHVQRGPTEAGADVVIREIGGGVYEATVTDALTDEDPSGVYLLDVQATGSSHGAPFVRSGNSAFTYSIPTGRITSHSEPRLVRDEAGLVKAFEVDFTVEVATADAFEITSLLTVTGPTGGQHPVAEAQTVDTLEPGTHTVTLSFDAGFAHFSKADGVLSLAKLTVYSPNQNVLMQRADDGFGVAFEPVKLTELRPLATVTPGQEWMRDNGQLERLASAPRVGALPPAALTAPR